ncbi:VOC family protein [Macrococcoides caseolyticum]|uniref:VOC family protein n=1 Tax=Macrococcoides caseolyticum TaxID=69966 RepID=UPI001F31F27D|nr:VOC family protein [Macrococcus caseolyticus]MCE4956455.1 VOC family protein [Macrococcus caseolyticus]
MNLQFDHIIHYVKGIDTLHFPGNKLKLTPGGQHMTLGTKNILSRIDLSYIEFIDIFNQQLIEQAMQDENERLSFASSLGRTDYEEGFVRLCYRTDNIEDLNEHFKSKGLKTIGPLQMERVTPTGECIRWQLLYIDKAYDFELPFFIEWGANDKTRYHELEGAMQRHLKIDTIVIETTDFDRTAEVFVEWLDYEVVGGVINTYFLLKKKDAPNIKIIPGNSNKIRRLEMKTQDASLIGEHLVHEAVYAFI